MDGQRLQGLALFAFIPLVLFLFTRPPEFLGTGASLLAGVAIMLGHRLVAAPWVYHRASQRSLWSGATLAGEGYPAVRVETGGRLPIFGVRDLEERHSVLHFAAFAVKRSLWLRLAIFLPLLLFLLSSLHLELSANELVSHQREWSLVLFQGVIATTVLITAWRFRFAAVPPGFEPIPFPLPIHNLALIGIRNTLGVFVIVGAYWIAVTILRVRWLLDP